MRLATEKKEFIKNILQNYSNTAKVYLFGSRVDDSKKGGDIDLVILDYKKFPRKLLREIKVKYFTKFGMEKLDLVSYSFNEDNAFKKLIMLESLEL